ncbi:MAG: TolC family protein [Alphaproteobacteria bacterium]|nr:MAG: TolC family protein [Alphaproteobacteria bacterium]
MKNTPNSWIRNAWKKSLLAGCWTLLIPCVCAQSDEKKALAVDSKRVGSVAQSAAQSANTHFLHMLQKGFFRDPKVQAALESYKGSKYDIAAAWFSSFMPNVSVSGQIRGSKKNPRPSPIDHTRSHTGSLNISQNIFNSGASYAQMRKAQLTTEKSIYDFQNAQNDYVLRAAGAYMGYITAKRVVAVNQASVRALLKQYESVKVRAELGDSTLTDVAQAEVAYVQAQSKLLSAESNFATAIEAYQVIFDELPPSVLHKPSLAENLIPSSVKEMQMKSEKENLELRAQKIQADSAQYDVTVTRAALLPRVDAEASIGHAETSYTKLRGRHRATTTDTAIKVTIPIINNGGTSYIPSLMKVQHMASSQMNAYQAKREEVRIKAVQNWKEFMALRKILAHNQSEVKAASLSLEGAREEFKVGSRTMLEVLDSEAKYLQAQVQLAQNEQKYMAQFFMVLAFSGTLDPKNIGLDAAKLS